MYAKVKNDPEESEDGTRTITISADTFYTISTELRNQLQTWYDLLPENIKPALDNSAPSVEDVILMLRYHAAGDIIFRPFLLHVCSLKPIQHPSEQMLENCRACIGHCQGYLDIVNRRLEAPSGSVEIVLHS